MQGAMRVKNHYSENQLHISNPEKNDAEELEFIRLPEQILHRGRCKDSALKRRGRQEWASSIAVHNDHWAQG
jgi:hypothetical protein